MLKTLIPRRMIRLRQLHGWSLRALADAAGVAASSLQELEAGKSTDVKLSTLEAIAGAFGITVAELLAEGPPPEPPAQVAVWIQERHEAHHSAASIASRLGLHVDSVQHILNSQYETLRLQRL